MARKYKEKLPSGLAPHKSELPPTNALPFENEVRMYANWKWFKFEREYEPAWPLRLPCDTIKLEIREGSDLAILP